MKRFAWTIFVLSCCHWASAQQFQKKLSVPLRNGEQVLHTNWVDANNDSLLDIVFTSRLLGKDSLFVLYDVIHNGSLRTSLTTGFDSAQFIPEDIDRDNKMDLIFSGKLVGGTNTTSTFLNKGNKVFQSQPTPLINQAPSKIRFVDLNNDGFRDAVLIRTSQSLALFKNQNNAFSLLFDSTLLKVHDFAIADFDGNGFQDIALSGRNQANQVILTVIEFRNNYDTLRVVHLPNAVDGTLETGDLNHDGFQDVLVSGVDNLGTLVTRSFLGQQKTFLAGFSYTGLKNAHVSIADFDSDGQADIAFRGSNNLNTPLNWIHTASGDSIVLAVDHVIDQLPGDFDRDGDLDLLQVTDTFSLVLWENKVVQKNLGPSHAFNSIAVRILSRLFAYWDKPSDDHTPVNAITYDLAVLSGVNQTVAGEFDLAQFHRLTVTSGNRGSNNFALLHVPDEAYAIQIQPIDNAFYTSVPVGGSGLPACANISTETITSCNQQTIVLTNASPQAMWFSFSNGFLGANDSVKLDPNFPDSVFSFIPQQPFSCANIKIYTVQTLAADTLFKQLKHTVCKDGTVPLSIDTEWTNVVWQDSARHSLGTGNAFLYQNPRDETITAIGKNTRGCFIKQHDVIKVSKPILTLNGTGFQILKGQSVDLHASGGESYQWTPATGLDRTDIPDPVASPTVTTEYTVTVTDSIGCKVSGSILVEVSETAFIANLFTPNGDGKNDALKIFGLSSATHFKFWIYNRNGTIVFETDDYQQASNHGWDGNVNGNQQPSGVYYWKLEGTDGGGQPLKLNGKRTGSALLLR